MHKWKESQSVGVMIITGSGDAFSAGFDLTEFNHPERFSEIFGPPPGITGSCGTSRNP